LEIIHYEHIQVASWMKDALISLFMQDKPIFLNHSALMHV